MVSSILLTLYEEEEQLKEKQEEEEKKWWSGDFLSTASFQAHVPAGQVSSAPGLEADHDVCDLHVSLLLQLGQDSGSEEDFALTDAVEVRVQLQSFDLQHRRGDRPS